MVEEVYRQAQSMSPYQLINAYKSNVENVDGGDGDFTITMLINRTLMFIKYLGGNLETFKVGLR